MSKIKVEYLKAAKNLQELKKLYFELAKKYHPDVNKEPNASEIMKQINNEYDYLKTILKNADNTKKAETETTETMNKFQDIIDILIKYNNIKIEIIGSWLWVSGKGTFIIKDSVLMQQLHFKYSGAQKKFFWFSGIEENEGKFKGGFLQKAIDKFGITEINSSNKQTPLLV